MATHKPSGSYVEGCGWRKQFGFIVSADGTSKPVKLYLVTCPP